MEEICSHNLGSIVSSVIGLAFEGISSFLHHKRHKALHKVVNVMEKRRHYDYVWNI